MWELIRKNKRKSVFFFFLMGIVLMLLGGMIGSVFTMGTEGMLYGAIIAGQIWLLMSVISYFSGSRILLYFSGAREVDENVHRQLFNVVEEMKIAAGMKKLPRIYIIPEESMNAFATGNSPENSAIAVTAGLLSRLNRYELQGVIAHETSHIINLDVRFMTFAGVMLGTIVLISDIFLRSLTYSSGGRRYNSRSSGGGSVMIFLFILAIIFAIISPIIARLLYFAISRKREYLADATAVRLTRYPEGLANALQKISDDSLPLAAANKITAPMYISNPFKKKKSFFSNMFSTHPPVEERIRILKELAGGITYQSAYQKVTGKMENLPAEDIVFNTVPDAGIIGLTSDRDSTKPSIEPPVIQTAKDEKRAYSNIMATMNGFITNICECGLKIKAPAGYAGKNIKCPKCGKVRSF